MALTIQYTVVKEDNIELAMAFSAKSTKTAQNLGKEDNAVWANTVVSLMERIDCTRFDKDTSKEGIQKIGEELKKVMSSHILSKVTIPETGKDRDGKDFKVTGKDGMPKWSSWDQTRRIWAYIGDIAKVIAFGQETVLYPSQFKVAARCDILNSCKVAETPIKAIERLGKQMQLSLDKMVAAPDVLQARKIVTALSVNNLDPVDEATDLIDRMDAILSSVDQDSKDIIRTLLSRITVHFVPAS